MASLSEVVRVLSKHIFDTPDQERAFNDLRIRSVELTRMVLKGEEPLIFTKGRGSFSRDVNAKDCALLLIAVLVNDKANGVSEVVRQVQNLKVVDIKKQDRNLYRISSILDKPVTDLTILDCLTCILEDQAEGREELHMVLSFMATHYKKLDTESGGFHFSIDWDTPKLRSMTAIGKITDDQLSQIKHLHSFGEDARFANQLDDSYTYFGLSTLTIVEGLKLTDRDFPKNRYQDLQQDQFAIQKNASYVRKIKIGGHVIGVLAELLQEREMENKMMAAEMAPARLSDTFDDYILELVLDHLMSTNIRSFADLNTKSPSFLELHQKIMDYCEQIEIPAMRIGDIRDIQKRFHELDRGKKDFNDAVNRVYEQYRYNKELLQQTLTGRKKDK